MNKVAILFSILLGLTACNGISGDGRQSKKICINASQYELDFGVVPDTVSSLREQLTIYNESSDTVKITHIDKSQEQQFIFWLKSSIIKSGQKVRL